MYRFDAATGELLLSQTIHKDSSIFSFSFSKDFSMLGTASKDGTCRVINPVTFEIWQTLNKNSPVRSVFFSPLIDVSDEPRYHIFIVGGQDAKDVTTTKDKKGGFESFIYDIVTGKQMAKIKGHFGPVHSVECSPDG